MAQLKDLLVSGPSRLIGKLFANEVQLTTLNIPTTSNGTTYGPGTNNYIPVSNGTSIYWSSAAPNATTAAKLGSNAGSSTQPIYFANGVPTAITGNIANGTTGNAATATAFSSNATVTLTGDATGTSAGSTKSWSVPVTLANSGATAGSYGNDGNVSPSAGGTFLVPYVTVDAKGRVTAISNKTITLPTASSTASTVTTTEDTTNTLYVVGVTSSATTTLKRDTSVTVAGGTLTATTLSSNGVNANVANSSSAGGLSLYSTNPTGYGIAMRGGAAHGWITAAQSNANIAAAQGISTSDATGTDWAINFYNSGSKLRGFKFLHGGSSIASLNGYGYMQVNRLGLNRVGGTKFGRLYWYNAAYYTWVDYMSDSSAGNAPNGGQPAQLGNVTSWAKRSLIENGSGYGWVWEAASNTAIATTANTTQPTARMALSSSTGYLRLAPDASSDTCQTGGLIIDSSKNASSGNVAIELWRGGNASWQIANNSGTLYFKDNYTTAAQTTYTSKFSIAYNTGTVTARAIQPEANNTYALGTSSLKWSNVYATTFTGSLSGNASTASKLATARTLTVGSTGKTFDGSANVSWSHAEIGATVSNTWTGGTTAGPAIKTTVNGVAGTAVAIPSAGASASGVITTGAQTIAGDKTFNSEKIILGHNVIRSNTQAPGQGDALLGALGFKTGYPVYTDPTFLSGANSVGVYNNTSGGNVVHTRDTYSNFSITSPGTNSNYVIRIQTVGAASPGVGGFVQNISSRANAVFIQIFRALVPVGRNVQTASNNMGDSYKDEWLTSQAGTGKWEWYARRVICGQAGTFSGGGHVYLDGAAGTSSAPVTWYLAACNLYDLTRMEYDGLRSRETDAVRDYNNGTLTTFGYSTSGMASTSWLGSWDGYKLRAISPANAVKSAVGTTAIGSTSQPIYWDGSSFKASTSYANATVGAANALNFSHTNELFLGVNGTTQNRIWFNYRRTIGGATSGNTAITEYHFGNGNAGTTGVTLYAANFSGNAATATTATKANYLNLYEARGTTTTLNKAANYVAAGALFHLVASSSTSTTDNGKPPMGDANVLQMNWDNNGEYDAQLAISTSANRMEFRDQISTKKAWREVVTSTPGTAAGSGTQPVYISTTGVATAISYSLSASTNSSTANYMAYYSGANAISGTSSAQMIDGCLNLYPTIGNYREGIRIHPYSGWSDITLMGNTNTNTSGIATTDWFIGNNSGTFYITHAGSSSSSTGYLKASTENSAGYWQLYQRVGVNGISNTYNFYVNGSSYLNGDTRVKKYLGAGGGHPVIFVDNGLVTTNDYIVGSTTDKLTSSSSDAEWLKRLLVKLCDTYPDTSGVIFEGIISPNSVGYYKVYIYNTAVRDSTTQLPQYSYGEFRKYTTNHWNFGTSSYSYFCHQILYNSGTWGISISGTAAKATAANLTTTANAVAYYTNTTGTFGSKASANGALYATSANGALSWGTLPIAQGGTGLTSSPSMLVNLASTSAANVFQASPRPGVTGTLGVGNGGTGKTSWTQWGVLYASTTTGLTNTAAGGANTALMGKGAAAPQFVSVSPSVTWTDGTSSGPTLKVTVLGVESTAAAIPTATTTKSGIITTGAQTIAGEKTLSNTLTIKGLKATSGTDYGSTLPSSGSEGQIFFQISNEQYEIPTGGMQGTLLMKATDADRDITWTPSTIYVSNEVLYGAAWNDYAEYRETTIPIEAGRVVIENGDDTLSLSTERMQPGAEIVSDTFGFAIGKTEKTQTPIAAAGRVLAYPNEPRETYKPGRPVCSGPNGTVSQMTDEEARAYPWLIIGTVSAIPDYDTWGTGKVKIDGRIWIRIR